MSPLPGNKTKPQGHLAETPASRGKKIPSLKSFLEVKAPLFQDLKPLLVRGSHKTENGWFSRSISFQFLRFAGPCLSGLSVTSEEHLLG